MKLQDILKRLILIPLSAVLFTASAEAQTVLYRLTGDQNTQGFNVCASAGDVDADGKADVVVGGPGYSPHETARVFSGATGAILHDLQASFTSSAFGIAVAGLGDLDGDGHSEFAVAAADEAYTVAGQGVIRIYSGATGSVLRLLSGPAQADRLGESMAPAGDVNVDGFMDLIAGFPGSDMLATNGGGARVFSGLDGSILHTFYGTSMGSGFGHAVDGAGDVDNDGHADVIVGAYNMALASLPRGVAIVYSGATGAVLYTLEGDSFNDRFGASVSHVGDVNGDGFADFAVGAPDDDNNGSSSGSVRVFSGATGLPFYTSSGAAAGDQYCIAKGGVDLDHDGLPDVLVGALFENSGAGRVHLLRGYDGTPIGTWSDPTAGTFGRRVEIAGDTNADGYVDVVVGNNNQAIVISGFDCPITNYCVLSPNSVGPGGMMGWSGSRSVTQNAFTLRATGVGATTTGIFFYGANPAQTPFGNGVRCIAGQIFRLPVVQAVNGVLSHTMNLTSPPSPAGQITGGSHWRFQAWFRDSLGPAFFNLSDGLDVIFCP